MPTNWNDLKHKSSPEVRARLKREAHAELDRIGFHKLRQARQQTQVAVAERLKIGQCAVSRIEKQSDFLLSTLREYVGALGGELELRVGGQSAQDDGLQDAGGNAELHVVPTLGLAHCGA